MQTSEHKQYFSMNMFYVQESICEICVYIYIYETERKTCPEIIHILK